jgi:hypothetical protein
LGDEDDIWRHLAKLKQTPEECSTMAALQRFSMCPTCMYSYVDFKLVSSVEIGRCRKCGHVMCANCCESSFWSGYICPKCGCRKTEPIGRIKDPFDTPTLQEDLRDGKI